MAQQLDPRTRSRVRDLVHAVVSRPDRASEVLERALKPPEGIHDDAHSAPRPQYGNAVRLLSKEIEHWRRRCEVLDDAAFTDIAKQLLLTKHPVKRAVAHALEWAVRERSQRGKLQSRSVGVGAARVAAEDIRVQADPLAALRES